MTEPLNLTVGRYVRPFKAVAGSFQPGRIALGVLCVAILMCLGGLWDGIFGPGRLGPESGLVGASASPAGSFAFTSSLVVQQVDRIAGGVVGLDLGEVIGGLGTLFVRLPLAFWWFDPKFAVIFGLASLCVGAFFCVALARMSIIESATGARLPATEGLLFAARAWPRLMGSVLFPLLFVAFVALVLLVPAALLRVPGLNVLAALLHGLWLLLALLAVFAGTTTLLVLPLLPPTVAAERDDGLEAAQRCVSYLLARPLHLLLLASLSIIGISIGYVVATYLAAGAVLFAGSILDTWVPVLGAPVLGAPVLGAPVLARPLDGTLGPFPWPSTPPMAQDAGAELGATASLARRIAGWWELLLSAIVAGWMISALMSCATQTYLAIRESADGQDPDEVWGLDR